MTPEQAASAAETLACPACGSPAGSPCRTRGGDTAFRYHTGRLVLVPELAGEPEVVVPGDRGPGRPWQPRPAPLSAQARALDVPSRIGYACSTPASPGLQDQLDALRTAGCEQVFREDASARAKDRPERDKALRLAAGTRTSAGRRVILTVHELGRLARTSAELMTLAAALEADGIGLEVLTGPLAGTWDPRGAGSVLFGVLAAAAGLDRNYRREKSIEGQQAAAAEGRRGGRPRIFGVEMTAAALAMREQGTGVPEIAASLVIAEGRNAGQHPSLASVYRALADADAGAAARLASRLSPRARQETMRVRRANHRRLEGRKGGRRCSLTRP
jgi:DNA invertase Pin-like site-specific DNA recombinase